MKKLLLMLVPLALFAQVEIDTIIRLPSLLNDGFFIPELNRLYVMGEDQYYVVDCSTYQLKTQIPKPWDMGIPHYSWNWRRQKLYINVNPYPDSTLVIDVAADSVIGWLTYYRDIHMPQTYASDVDRLYKAADDTLYAFDCAADTVVRRILAPEPGYGIGTTSWDSVGRKLYVGMGNAGSPPPVLAVYDYLADSFTGIIDVSSVNSPGTDVLVFDTTRHKAYFSSSGTNPWAANVGILDTEHDSLLGMLPVRIWDGVYSQVALDERDGKIYLADNDANPATPDTLWVVDCATDSVLKKIEYEPRGWGAQCIRWVPWSNRIYIKCWMDHDPQSPDSGIVVLDCNTDSIIVQGLQLGSRHPADIQLDPVRERIFVIGADSGTIHVLRDVGYGVAEPPTAGPQLASGLQVQTRPGGFDLRYSVASPGRVNLAVYDLMGREVSQLVAEEQPAGEHSAIWNGRDRSGAAVARGVYFVRLDTPGFSDVKKAVVTR